MVSKILAFFNAKHVCSKSSGLGKISAFLLKIRGWEKIQLVLTCFDHSNSSTSPSHTRTKKHSKGKEIPPAKSHSHKLKLFLCKSEKEIRVD